MRARPAVAGTHSQAPTLATLLGGTVVGLAYVAATTLAFRGARSLLGMLRAPARLRPPKALAQGGGTAPKPFTGRLLNTETRDVAEATRLLRGGGVVALPTDTIYGIAASACDDNAVARLWEVKGRPASLPIAIAVADVDSISAYAETSHIPIELLRALLPGPVTLLLPRRQDGMLSTRLNPGVSSIGVRVPDSAFALQVLQELGTAIALTSANKSGEPSTLAPFEFFPMWPKLDAVFDGGRLRCGRAGSTIVDMCETESQGDAFTFHIVRQGSALASTVCTLTAYGGVPR